MILSQALNQASLTNPGNTAIVDLGDTFTYSELRKRVSQLSYLYATEIPAEARVAIIGANSAAVAATFFALTNIGSPVYFIDPDDSLETMRQDLTALGIKYLLATGSSLAKAREYKRQHGGGITIIELDKKKGGEFDTSYSAPPERPLREGDVALILKKSSELEDSRYLFFSHKKVVTSVMAVKKFYRLTGNDKLLGQISWSHPFGLTHGLLLPLFTGATCVVDPQSPTVEDFVSFLAAIRVTRFIGSPAVYLKLLTFCASQKYTLPGVKSITVGMGALSHTLRRTYQLLKIPVLRCYGQPEMVWSISMDPFEDAADIDNTKSRPANGVKCKVLDDNGDELEGPGAREGLLAVSADYVMDRYFMPNREEAATATRTALRGTWFYTESIARLEGEGDELTVAVLGKQADLLRLGPSYLSPQKIDLAARSIAGVVDGAGFVRVDPDGVRYFACAIVLERPGMKEAHVLATLKKELHPDYHPRMVFFVDSIPRETHGPVRRYLLQRQFS